MPTFGSYKGVWRQHKCQISTRLALAKEAWLVDILREVRECVSQERVDFPTHLKAWICVWIYLDMKLNRNNTFTDALSPISSLKDDMLYMFFKIQQHFLAILAPYQPKTLRLHGIVSTTMQLYNVKFNWVIILQRRGQVMIAVISLCLWESFSCQVSKWRNFDTLTDTYMR